MALSRLTRRVKRKAWLGVKQTMYISVLLYKHSSGVVTAIRCWESKGSTLKPTAYVFSPVLHMDYFQAYWVVSEHESMQLRQKKYADSVCG